MLKMYSLFLQVLSEQMNMQPDQHKHTSQVLGAAFST